MLKQQVRDLDPAPGVIAYLDGEAVGWCAVEPRPSYRRLDRMRILKGSPERPDDDSVWAVTCFVVRVGFRKRGVGRALLAGAVEHARRGGARVVEGYPVDPAQREKVSSAELPGGTTVVKSRSPPRPNVVAFEVPHADSSLYRPTCSNTENLVEDLGCHGVDFLRRHNVASSRDLLVRVPK